MPYIIKAYHACRRAGRTGQYTRASVIRTGIAEARKAAEQLRLEQPNCTIIITDELGNIFYPLPPEGGAS